MARLIFPAKYLIYATLILFLLVAVLFPLFPITAQPTRIPHENPAYAESAADITYILIFYSNVFSLANARRYQNASDMLAEIKYANIPDETRSVIDRYSALSRRLFDMLNGIESLLSEASGLISQNQVAGARQKLSEAEALILNAQIGLRDIELATVSLGEKVGTSSPHATKLLLQTYQRLKDTLAELKRLVDGLNWLRRLLFDSPLPDNPQVQAIKKSASFYYPTILEVSGVKEGPGLTVTVTGKIASTGEMIERQIILLLDNIPVAEETTRNQFQFQVVIPPNVSADKYTLTIIAAAAEKYSSASWTSPISVARIPIEIDARTPMFNVMPEFQVTGTVKAASTPIPDATVILDFKGVATRVKTADDGSFIADLSVPFDPSLFGPEQMVVTVEPKEPWYVPGKIDRWIFVISPTSTGLMLIALVSLGVLVFRKSRVRTCRSEENVSTEDRVCEAVTISQPEHEHVPIANQVKILAAYSVSLEIIVKVTAIAQAPYDTLREYARTVTPLIPSASHAFTELTAIVELALYSDQRIDNRTTARAESLACLVKESCSGTA